MAPEEAYAKRAALAGLVSLLFDTFASPAVSDILRIRCQYERLREACMAAGVWNTLKLSMENWANSRSLALVSRRVDQSAPMRKFLVFVVPSKDMASPLLRTLDGDRNFDVAARFYEVPGVNEPLLDGAEFVMTGGLSKFHSAALFIEELDLRDSYEGFLFLDGDLEFDSGALSSFLSLVHAMDLDLAQPSVTRDSHCYWKMAFNQPAFIYRETSFVEVMAPYMSRFALSRMLPTFSRSISGYGLDFVWPELIGRSGIGVVDAFQIRHAERVDYQSGAFYRYLSSLDIDISEEAQRVEGEYGVRRIQPHSRRGYYMKSETNDLNGKSSVASVHLPGIERFTNNQRIIDAVMRLARLGPRRRERALSEALSQFSDLA